MPLYWLHTPALLRLVMTASSRTTRLLSLLVVVLSLAPLGSIYFILQNAPVATTTTTASTITELSNQDHPPMATAAYLSYLGMQKLPPSLYLFWKKNSNAVFTFEEVWSFLLSHKDDSSSQKVPRRDSHSSSSSSKSNNQPIISSSSNSRRQPPSSSGSNGNDPPVWMQHTAPFPMEPSSSYRWWLTFLFRPKQQLQPPSLPQRPATATETTSHLSFQQQQQQQRQQHEQQLLYQYHWILLLPWIVSLLFGVVLPAVLSMVSFVHARRQWLRHRPREYGDGDTIAAQFGGGNGAGYYYYCQALTPAAQKRRMTKLKQKLEHYTKTLRETDQMVETSPPSADPSLATVTPITVTAKGPLSREMVEEDDEVVWKLPLPGQPRVLDGGGGGGMLVYPWRKTIMTHSGTTRWVRGTCAICLCHYRIGEDIVWSQNSACVHCFHENCILAWLCRKSTRCSPPCPCCRQAFVVR